MFKEGSIVHRIQFSEEAVFDYEHVLVVAKYPKCEFDFDWQVPSKYDEPQIKLNRIIIKAEIEEYIQRHSKRNYVNFFRVRHYDEQLGQWIMLFIKRDRKTENYQYWVVYGICFADDYIIEDLYGYWLGSGLESVEKEDWVASLRKQLENEKQDYEFMERKVA